MTYRVQFKVITHNRKRDTYRVSFPSDGNVAISDYGVDAAGDYAEAAFRRRPHLRDLVSSYEVSELVPLNGRRLIARHFCSGNDHPNCRRFFE